MKSGAFDIIKKAELANWVQDNRFAGILPTWIGNLIRTQAGDSLLRYDLPSDDTAFKHGYDGFTETQQASFNVPKGKAYWELGSEKHVRKKAEYEYLRVADQLGEEAKKCTFVFVTPRPFPNKKKKPYDRFNERTLHDWINARNQEGLFKEVRVIDEATLREWSKRHLDIALSIKKIFEPTLNYNSEDIKFPRDVIKKYISSFNHKDIDRKVLLSGREELTTKVCNFNTLGRPLEIYGSTEEEALAFVCAALDYLSPNDHKTPQTLVILKPQIVSMFEGYKGKTFVLSSTVKDEAYRLRDDNYVIICSPVDANSIRHDNVLRDPKVETLSEILKDCGFEDADKYAAMAGGSISCLRRILGGSSTKPDYISKKSDTFEYVIYAALLGAWNESPIYSIKGEYVESFDKALITSAIQEDISYFEFNKKLFHHIDRGEEHTAEDKLLKRIDDNYWVKSPIDALDNLLNYLEQRHFDFFEKVLIDVFSNTNQMPQDPLSPDMTHSNELKLGLALNYCILAHRGSQLNSRFGRKESRVWVADVFQKINNAIDFQQFIEDQSGLLGYFAEACPEVFMDALEEQLQGNPDGIKKLFTPEEDKYLFDNKNKASGLLFALQRLAWYPSYFERIVEILIELHRLDAHKQSNIYPRPSSVFHSLFITFAPQTSVDWDERVKFLSKLPYSKNEFIFPLIASALPQGHDTVCSSPKPIFGRFNSPKITRQSYFEANSAMFKCALERTDALVDRICIIVSNFPNMSDDIFINALSQMQTETSHLNLSSKRTVWEQLRALIVRHKRFPDAKWVMSTDRLDALSSWRDNIKPEREHYLKFVFSRNWIDDYDEEDSWDQKKLNEARITEVKSLLSEKGIDFTLEFSSEINEKIVFGESIVRSINEVPIYINLLESAFKIEGLSDDLLIGIGWAGKKKYENDTINWLFEEKNIKEFSSKVLTILTIFPINSDIINKFNLEHISNSFVEKYWQNVRINFWPKENISLSEIEGLIQHDRQTEILTDLYFHLDKQNDEVLRAIMTGIYKSMHSLDKKQISSNLISSIFKLFKICRERKLFSLRILAQYEVPLAKQFRWNSEKYPFAIHELATSDANTFVELLACVYKTSKPHPVLENAKNEDENKWYWDIGYHTLDTMRHPKLEKGENVDVEDLKKWISDVISASKEYGLDEIASYKIGEILAHASEDEKDGIWPRREVREIIETISNKEMLSGIQIKEFNERGVYSDGFNHFNNLAGKFENDASKLKKWPKTKKLLLNIAKQDRKNAEDARLSEEKRNARPKIY
jgi:hypothetical protein